MVEVEKVLRLGREGMVVKLLREVIVVRVVVIWVVG